MIRNTTLSLATVLTLRLLAASGGPDQYGYTWKDSNEPGGPVYNWIDITSTGQLINGLADDNVVGPVVLGENFPYYWYSVKKIFIGSNGYITFGIGGNIAANFPTLPLAGETDNYVAGFMTDLNFAGDGNPGQCYVYDDLDRTIVSYLNVPYWTSIEPLYTGSNTFQFILNKLDSTITIQYMTTPCCSGSNGPFCGIEAINGDIGLMQNSGIYNPDGFAVRFYAPQVPLISIADLAVDWVTDESNGGRSLAVNGTPFSLTAFIENTGQQIIPTSTLTSQILNEANQVVAVDAMYLDTLYPGQTMQVTFANSFVPSAPGTYRSVTTISGVAGESVTTNNSITQELVAYATNILNNDVDWAGQSDDGIGIGWTGGQAGCGAYILPPYYPIYVSHTTCRIVSNFGNAPFTMKVYDDNGPGGSPGTLLDSVWVDAANGQAGDHAYPLNTPFMLTDGGLYVQWYMQGQNVNIAQDIAAPYSLRSYEVIQGAWADYRDREIADFHLGLRMGQLPVQDVGCSSMDQPVDGAVITANTAVRTWVRNYGNLAITNIPVNYQYNGGSVVTQNYNGPVIPPGDSVLFMFAQPLLALVPSNGALCTWSSYVGDNIANDDTTCVQIMISQVGIEEQNGVQLRLSPVPATDRLRIDGLPAGLCRFEVYDMTGALRMDRSQRVAGPLELPVDHLADGAYVLRATSGRQSTTARFVVGH